MAIISKQNLLNLEKNGSILEYVDISSITFQEPEQRLSNSSITVEMSVKEFSFKDRLIDNDFVQNPNIIEKKDFERIRNTPLDMIDKFDNENDTFFDLDDQRPVVDISPVDNTTKSITNLASKKLLNKISKTASARSPVSKTYKAG
jgi:hypothetical protein